MVRVQHGRAILSSPVRLPSDAAIPVEAVPATAAARPFVTDKQVLQREQKAGVPTWLKTVAPVVVLLIALGFAGALAWGVARIGRDAAGSVSPPPRPAAAPRSAATPLPS